LFHRVEYSEQTNKSQALLGSRMEDTRTTTTE
jgi:hypothetical protein